MLLTHQAHKINVSSLQFHTLNVVTYFSPHVALIIFCVCVLNVISVSNKI